MFYAGTRPPMPAHEKRVDREFLFRPSPDCFFRTIHYTISRGRKECSEPSLYEEIRACEAVAAPDPAPPGSHFLVGRDIMRRNH